MVDCFVEYLKDWKAKHPHGWIVRAEDWNDKAKEERGRVTDNYDSCASDDPKKKVEK